DVAGREDLRRRSLVVECVGGDVAARIELDARLVDHAGLARAEETHREQNKIGPQLEAAARHLLHRPAPIRALHPFDTDAFQLLDIPVPADGAFRQHRPFALTALLLRRGGVQLQWPVRPDERLVFLVRRLWQDFELGDRFRALAVPAADDDDMLAFGGDRALRRGDRLGIAGDALILLR